MKNDKIYFVYLIVLILLVSFVLLNQRIINSWYELQVNQTCVEEKRNNYKDFVEGQILVTFNTTVNEFQARNLIKSYGLLTIKSGGTENIILRIEVPTGNELKWLCILEKEKNYVISTSPNSYTQIS